MLSNSEPPPSNLFYFPSSSSSFFIICPEKEKEKCFMKLTVLWNTLYLFLINLWWLRTNHLLHTKLWPRSNTNQTVSIFPILQPNLQYFFPNQLRKALICWWCRWRRDEIKCGVCMFFLFFSGFCLMKMMMLIRMMKEEKKEDE